MDSESESDSDSDTEDKQTDRQTDGTVVTVKKRKLDLTQTETPVKPQVKYVLLKIRVNF